MNHPDPYIASEYAYRIFRTFVEITKHDWRKNYGRKTLWWRIG
jgi:hypothetical protein